MRDLIDIGKNENCFVDADLVIAILPNEAKKFGSIVVVQGISHPVASSLSPLDVTLRLSGELLPKAPTDNVVALK